MEELPAFPGAEGFGSNATHGRGGEVVYVTNLNDSGPGSLREALEASGPRIIMFEVEGEINLKSDLEVFEPNVMVAGQSAPGDGITLTGASLNIATHDVVVRHIKSRPGDGEGVAGEDRDGIKIEPYAALDVGLPGEAYNIVVDHASISWAVDENVGIYGSYQPDGRIMVEGITIQNSIISEALDDVQTDAAHPKGAHSKGLLVGGGAENVTLHHNLFSSNVERNPLFGAETSGDVVNNVFYNAPNGVGLATSDGSSREDEPAYLNIVGNMAVEGPDTQGKGHVATIDGNYLNGSERVFAEDNKSAFRTGDQQDEWDAINVVGSEEPYRSDTRVLDAPPITTTSAEQAYEDVLNNAGARPWSRDAVDDRVVSDVKTGGGGFIDSPSEVGGLPESGSARPPQDTDRDGMSDEWEDAYGLDENDAGDGRLDRNNDGYTNVEEYLDHLAAGGTELPAPADPGAPVVFADDGSPRRVIEASDVAGGGDATDWVVEGFDLDSSGAEKTFDTLVLTAKGETHRAATDAEMLALVALAEGPVVTGMMARREADDLVIDFESGGSVTLDGIAAQLDQAALAAALQGGNAMME